MATHPILVISKMVLPITIRGKAEEIRMAINLV